MFIAEAFATKEFGFHRRCRKEDNARRWHDNVRRQIDEKSEQLKGISSLAALIAGFSMVTLVEFNIPEGTSEFLVAPFYIISSLCICVLLASVLLCTNLLVGVISFNPGNEQRQQFHNFWNNYCKMHWERAFKAFEFGIPLFLMNLVMMAWIQLQDYTIISPLLITLIVTIAIMFWLVQHRLWSSYLSRNEAWAVPAETEDNLHDHLVVGDNQERNITNHHHHPHNSTTEGVTIDDHAITLNANTPNELLSTSRHMRYLHSSQQQQQQQKQHHQSDNDDESVDENQMRNVVEIV
eukprot:TRINITY_DN344406_c0_g1_i1.p1 TRINITY_DN344406_c0_g1~~TRINITY_DN344406_c0_g1_i1.p1  ORF type:complete len:294 (-),score=58.83 TRINITY_DN344406_c0_g1_i1:314-1195(-)